MLRKVSVSRWAGLSTFNMPRFALSAGLKGRSLSVLALMYQQLNTRPRGAGDIPSLRISQQKIAVRTGLSSRASITAAITDLVSKQLLRVQREEQGRSKRGAVQGQLFGVNRYEPLNPATGRALQYKKGEGLLFANGVEYFRFPQCVVVESERPWSMAQLSSAELCAYLAICSFANWQGHQLELDALALRKRSGIQTPVTFKKAIAGLEAKGLIWEQLRSNVYRIDLCDPFTGELPHIQTADPADDPSNYFARSANGKDRQYDFNSGYRHPEYVERLLKACLGDGIVITVAKTTGNFKINCPFHDDHTASFSVSPSEQVFFCHACDAKGRLADLVMRTRGFNEQQAHRFKRELLSDAATFHRRRDKDAKAIYSYFRGRKLLKQKLRFEELDAKGNVKKTFYVRRPAPGGGWINDADGVPPCLYQHDEVNSAEMVILTESEKDCDRLTEMLRGGKLTSDHNGATPGLIAATTTGGKNSWVDCLADDLLDKRVVVVPDTDLPGGHYRDSILSSLQSRGIQHRVVDLLPFGAKDISRWLDQGRGVAELADLINNAGFGATDWVWLSHDAPLTKEVTVPKGTL